LIFLPTLNNHGSFNSEDYAGPTSALKCHLGIVDFAGTTGVSWHGVGYNSPMPEAWKSPPTPLFLRGELKSPFAKGDLGGFPMSRYIHQTFYFRTKGKEKG
jgi:hypothetical protein